MNWLFSATTVSIQDIDILVLGVIGQERRYCLEDNIRYEPNVLIVVAKASVGEMHFYLESCLRLLVTMTMATLNNHVPDPE